MARLDRFGFGHERLRLPDDFHRHTRRSVDADARARMFAAPIDSRFPIDRGWTRAYGLWTIQHQAFPVGWTRRRGGGPSPVAISLIRARPQRFSEWPPEEDPRLILRPPVDTSSRASLARAFAENRALRLLCYRPGLRFSAHYDAIADMPAILHCLSRGLYAGHFHPYEDARIGWSPTLEYAERELGVRATDRYSAFYAVSPFAELFPTVSTTRTPLFFVPPDVQTRGGYPVKYEEVFGRSGLLGTFAAMSEAHVLAVIGETIRDEFRTLLHAATTATPPLAIVEGTFDDYAAQEKRGGRTLTRVAESTRAATVTEKSSITNVLETAGMFSGVAGWLWDFDHLGDHMDAFYGLLHLDARLRALGIVGMTAIRPQAIGPHWMYLPRPKFAPVSMSGDLTRDAIEALDAWSIALAAYEREPIIAAAIQTLELARHDFSNTLANGGVATMSGSGLTITSLAAPWSCELWNPL